MSLTLTFVAIDKVASLVSEHANNTPTLGPFL